MSRPLLRVLILVAAIATVIPAASSANATSPPTWPNHYDWPASGQGYAGWHSSTTASDDYGMRSALGDQHGLWLWPLGGHKTYNSTDYAQWTYTAPGTTALKTVTLSYAWTNKLLAHHCIDVGFLDASGKIVTKREACKPPPQSPLRITLTDPSDNPTSKVLYFRIRVDCGGAKSCSKTIPTKDPLKNGAYARLLKADMTLVDDDNPTLTPSGPFFDLAGTAVYGDRSYDLTASADDAGAGVTRVWLEQNGSEIASVDATCDRAHNTPPLDNRVCPKQKTLSTSIDTSKLAEGNYIYVVKAEDVAGNVGQSGGWLVVVDRTPPDAVPSGSFHDLGGTAIFGDRSYDLTVNADDSLSGVARVWVEQNGAEIASASAVCNPDRNPLPPDNRICPLHKTLSATIDTSKLAEGAYIYVVKAEDAAGNIGKSEAWLVVVDRTPPGVTPSGSFYGLRGTTTNTRQSYDLNVTADDALSGVSRLWVEQNGAEIASVDSTCNPDHNPLPPDNRICPLQKTLSTSIDTSKLADGSYTYVVKARDAAGNVGSQSWTVVIDRTPPTISLSGSLYDVRGTTASEDNYELTANANDSGSGVGRIWLEENGEVIASVGDSCAPMGNIPPSGNPCPQQRTLTTSVDVSELLDGTYTFVVKAEDAVGNLRQSEPWTLVIDLAAEYGPGDDNAAGGGADGYDPDLDTSTECDAYSDFGIANWCTSGDDSEGSDNSEESMVADASLGTARSSSSEITVENSSISQNGPTAVFWANRGAKIIVKQLELYVRDSSHHAENFGSYYFAIEPGEHEKAPVLSDHGDDRYPTPDPDIDLHPMDHLPLSNAVCMMNDKYDRKAPGGMPTNIHAAPVFNWSAWSDWRQTLLRRYSQSTLEDHGIDVSWKGMGILFRQAMKAHNCQPGDTWLINELPSVWRTEDNPNTETHAQAVLRRSLMRARITSLLKGLYQSTPNDPFRDMRGFAADVVNRHDKTAYTGLLNYKNSFKLTFGHQTFWSAVDAYTQGWTKEAYNRCSQFCVPGKSASEIADDGVMNYSYHQRYLGIDAPDKYAWYYKNGEQYPGAKTAIRNRYTPLLNAEWNNSIGVKRSGGKITDTGVYDTLNMPVTRMTRMIREQIYTARRAEKKGVGSDRIGFAWKEPDYGSGRDDEEDIAKKLASQLVSSLIKAYQGDPIDACLDNSGNDLCKWTSSGPAFNTGWDRFKHWSND